MFSFLCNITTNATANLEIEILRSMFFLGRSVQCVLMIDAISTRIIRVLYIELAAFRNIDISTLLFSLLFKCYDLSLMFLRGK